jgi:UDP-N-acetylglucosamine acyltransferase
MLTDSEFLIYPDAQIHADAKIHPSVKVGQGSVIGPGVSIDAGTIIGPHCFIEKNTSIGKNNHFYFSVVVGTDPQDLKYDGQETYLKIGDYNTFREFVTLHRSAASGEATIIHNHNYFMAYAHVGHDCRLGNHILLSNAATLGGHVHIQDFAVLGGMVPVHQFCKIGAYSFIAGGYRVVKDVPPFVMAGGDPLAYKGLNATGLSRQNFTENDMKDIKGMYKLLYRGNNSLEKAIELIEKDFRTNKHGPLLLDFIADSNRGLIRPRV